MRRGCQVLGLLLSLALPTLSPAATYHVAPHGSDEACGPATQPGRPLRTINYGLLCLAPGDTLLIQSGVYIEALNTFSGTQWPRGTSWEQPITIAGVPGATVILRPAGVMPVVLLYDDGAYADSSYREYLILDNLTLDGSQGSGTVVKFDVGSRRVRLQHSRILGNASSNGIQWGGDTPPTTHAREHEVRGVEISGNAGYGLYVGGQDNLIEGNDIHDNQGYGIHVYADRGGVHRSTVRHNRLHRNGYGYSIPTCGILLASGTGHRACGNTIEDHQGCGVQVYGNAVDAQVFRNTIAQTAGACIAVDPGAQGTQIGGNQCRGTQGEVIDAGRGTVQGSAGDCGGTPGTSPPLAQPRPAPTNLRVLGQGGR